jgi:hypothetical protein
VAAPCANVVWEGGPVCGAKKIAPVHSVHHPEYHKYFDKTPSDLGMSAGTRDYLASQKHQEVYAQADEQRFCLAHRGGAPEQCRGPLTRHHVFARSAAGGQEQAEDGWPVITVCEGFNGDVESKPRVRAWAERTTFVWHVDGKEYPFRISARMARQLKAARP